MQPDYSRDVQGIVQQWYDAAEKEVLNEKETTKLYHNTGQIVQTLQELKNAGQTEKVKDLSNILIQKFNDRDIGESELLAHWASKNEGAYESLHELFQLVADVNNYPQAFTTEFDNSPQASHLSSIINIDAAALNYFDHPSTNPAPLRPSIPQVRDVEKIILSNLDSESLGALGQTSKYQNELFKSHLIDRLNTGEIAIKDLGFKSIPEIINYFGKDNCAKIIRLNLKELHKPEESWQAYERENLNFAASFPNLKHLSLSAAPPDMLLPKNLESLDVSHCYISNFNFIRPLKSLKELDVSHNLLNNLNYNDFPFLNELEKLEKINIYNNNLNDPDIFRNNSKLVNLNIQMSKIPDIYFIKNFSGLTTFCFGSDNKDISRSLYSSMKVLQECPSLTNLEIRSYIKIKREFLDYLKLPNLKHLVLPRVDSYDFLSDCTSLESFEGQLSSLKILEKCPQIKKIAILDYYNENLSELPNLDKLEEIVLDVGEFQDISALENFPSLKKVILKDCKDIPDGQIEKLRSTGIIVIIETTRN